MPLLCVPVSAPLREAFSLVHGRCLLPLLVLEYACWQRGLYVDPAPAAALCALWGPAGSRRSPLLFHRRLLDYNQTKMPFAASQIGLGFRNEIAPRNGLLRVREFTMAEIEHFVHPKHKEHAKFANVENVVLVLFPGEAQLTTGKTVNITAGQAVRDGVINNQTLGYYIARTQVSAIAPLPFPAHP